MARSPDFLLGFGFASRDRGLLRYLKAVKQGLTSVQDQFADIEKSSKTATTGPTSVTQAARTMVDPTRPEFIRGTGRGRFGSRFDDHRAFTERIKESISPPDERKMKMAQLERTLNALNRRYQETGDRLGMLKKFTAAYVKELKRAKLRSAFEAIGKGIQNVTERALTFIGVNEKVARFLIRQLPSAISMTIKGIGKLGKAFMGLFRGRGRQKKGLPELLSPKKKLWENLFFRRKDITGVVRGVGNLQKAVAAKMAKAQPGAAVVQDVDKGIERAKKRLTKLDIGGTITRSVRAAMEKVKEIIEKADIKKTLANEFKKARDRATTQLEVLDRRVKKAVGKGMAGRFSEASTKIKGTLGKLAVQFKDFSDNVTENVRKLIPPVRDVGMELRSNFDDMWTHLRRSGKKSFDGVIEDKERFVRKFDKNFRDLASKTEVQLGRIGTEAGKQFSRMSRAARTSFEQMGDKLEKSITEAVRTAKRDTGAAERGVLMEAQRGKRVRERKQTGNLVVAEKMSQMEEMAQKLMEAIRARSGGEEGMKAGTSKGQVINLEGLEDVVAAIEALGSQLVSRLSRVEGAIGKSAPRSELIPSAKKEEGGGGLMELASFIPQLRGLSVLKGLMR